MITRPIPSSGERVPVIGLGTWQTFDLGPRGREPLAEVLRRFAAAGGKLIDSSPMYGRAEAVVGDLKENVPGAFIATKVWTRGREAGMAQMGRSASLLRTPVIDLMQVHNLLDWRTHLATLRRWKGEGRVRYIGVTHYTTSAFADLESILAKEEIDFVQLPLSVGLPDAERRLLPLAADRGVAVLVNRPFEEGALLRGVRRLELPEWAAEFGSSSWGELMLRYVVSHPAVTCVIPATANPDHMKENLRAGEGVMLDESQRLRLRKLLVRPSS